MSKGKRNPMARALESDLFKGRVIKSNTRKIIADLEEKEAEDEIKEYLNGEHGG